MIEVRFNVIRGDWYRANQLLPRIVRKALSTSDSSVFKGFPRQWIPLFEYYGLAWVDCRQPQDYIPLVSEMSDRQLAIYCNKARDHGTLRTLVESIVVLDPVMADFLYILDHTTAFIPSSQETENVSPRTIRLTNWQSYGRPEVRALDKEIDKIETKKSVAIVLPCSLRRPYNASRTHKRIWGALSRKGFKPENVHQIVMTSLGVLPEELWTHPTVLRYDAGVPDIYRNLRLARRFFQRNRYQHVLDCLGFAPYSDVLTLLRLEGTIKDLTKGPVKHSRQFHLRSWIKLPYDTENN